eukprot:Pgem_evm1s6826
MKILTDRIVPVLSDLISPGQSCNVPGRIISDNIKYVQTKVWAMSRNNIENLQLVNTVIKKDLIMCKVELTQKKKRSISIR